MTIWGVLGFILFSAVGAFFYYRALSEVRGKKTKEDLEMIRDDDLLMSLQPFATVAFSRPVAVANGDQILYSQLKEKARPKAIEQIGLPITATREFAQDLRRRLHTFQILALGQIFSSKDIQAGDFTWPQRKELLQDLVNEWPGYDSEIKGMAQQFSDEVLLPELKIKSRSQAIAVAPSNSENSRRAQPKEKIDKNEEQKRVKRSSASRGLSIERAEADDDSTRSWEGEKRDEQMGHADELPPDQVQLTSSPTPVAAEVRLQSAPVDRPSTPEKFSYDEWDCFAGRYKKNYCQVEEQVPLVNVDQEAALWTKLHQKRQVVKEITRIFEALRPLPRRLRRQKEGDAIDLDAYVQMAIEKKCGGTVNEDIYEKIDRVERSVAVTLLMDLSASTEQWVGQRRVFDIVQEATGFFALGQMALEDPLEFMGFSGSGPEKVHITSFKKFDEDLNDVVFHRLSSAAPQAFTRIATGIRHASRSLEEQESLRKFLIILSDSKPQDEDGYEGQYAWADTRKALDECRKKGITPFCLTVDREAGSWLKAFYKNQFSILLDPEKLPQELPKVFARLSG